MFGYVKHNLRINRELNLTESVLNFFGLTKTTSTRLYRVNKINVELVEKMSLFKIKLTLITDIF